MRVINRSRVSVPACCPRPYQFDRFTSGSDARLFLVGETDVAMGFGYYRFRTYLKSEGEAQWGLVITAVANHLTNFNEIIPQNRLDNQD
jgi:hypothetical protein